MILENLVLTNYKNYSNEKFEFSSEINCFVGQNGSGKTNILDAIYFLAMTKSNFQSKDKILLFEDSYFFTLSTKIQESDSNHDVFAAFQTGKRKNFKFDDFLKSQQFVNKVGEIAEAEVHHPDLWYGWGYARIKIFTHAIKGLAESDLILAAKIDHISNV